MGEFKYLFLLFFVFNITNAQNYKFGKGSKKELQEKFNSIDSSAVAAYLYKYRKTYFVYKQDKFVQITEVHNRLKIYKKEGFDFATKSINLHKSGSKREKLSNIKAYTEVDL